jgi:homoserine O-acetyltransferase
MSPPRAAQARFADARRYAALPDPFPLHGGGSLHGAQIAYETWGSLSPARDNAILLFTGLSPTAHAAASREDPSPGWWEGMIGPGRAIDTDRWHVVCVNSLGSCFGSTGPASIDPATGAPYRLAFPALAVEDIANAGYATMRALGVERIDTVIGPSLGGMVVFAHAAQHSGHARRLVSVSGTLAASPFAIALRSVQREAVLRDPDWRAGQYAPDAPPRAGLTIARKLGTITYRSAAEWAERFGREPIDAGTVRARAFAPEFAVEGYLTSQAERFVRTFDANCYLYLSRAMDRFALQGFPPRPVESALVVGVESDFLFRIDEQRAAARALESAGVATHFAPLPSLEGHDAFLVDLPRFSEVLGAFLRGD